MRPAWRALHIGTNADTGEIVAAALTDSDMCDASQVGPLLDQVTSPVISFTADGAYDWRSVYDEIAKRYPDAAVVVPPRCDAVPSSASDAELTQRDQHIHLLAERGRMQVASGYNWRTLVEADASRFKRVIGDGLRSRTDLRRATEVAIAVSVLNRMLDLGRPQYVRTA